MKQPNHIVVVSKPLGPPWNDSGKNLVRDIIANLPAERFRAFTLPGARLNLPNVLEEEISSAESSFAPSLAQNARLFIRLLRPDGQADIYHFFFTPNPRSCAPARLLMRLKRKPCVQNVSSEPASRGRMSSLIFGDRVVVHSDHLKSRLESGGARNVVRIYPGIIPPAAPSPDAIARARSLIHASDGPVILYPGDYRFSGAIPALIPAMAQIIRKRPDARFVLACRIKIPADRDYERRMIGDLQSAGLRGNVEIVNDAPDFTALIAACDLAVFPVTSLYAKMDIPLAIMECLAIGKPLILSEIGPLKEILTRPAGLLIPPDAPELLAKAINELLDDEGTRRAMGTEGRRIVEERFDIRRTAAAYADIYRELRNEACR